MLAPRLRKGTRFDCIAPAGCDGHCCWGDGTIYIFPDDVARLLDHLAMDLDTFLDTHVKIEEITCMNDDSRDAVPVLSIKERDNGACAFLSDGLCTVHVARPFQCRGYPFWKLNVSSNARWQKLVDYCPGARLDDEQAKSATIYNKSAIKKLVDEELDIDDIWEEAMVKWNGDYRAFLKDHLEKKGKKNDR